MNPAERPLRRRLRAPDEHGQALVDPPLSTLGDWRVAVDSRRTDLVGPSLICQARAELLQVAAAHTSQYRDLPNQALEPATSLIMSGHQPELFHPGVWFKNFLLSALAKHHGAIAINLVIDNDIVASPAIRVPTGSRAVPRVETVAIDEAAEGIPYEERLILDRGCFDRFDQAVIEAVRGWIPDPLVTDLWRHARSCEGLSLNLGYVLAAARHSLEQDCGLVTLEAPLSAVASERSFRQFIFPLLCDAPRLRDIYNAALQRYRTINRIRSRSHPMPELIEDGGWCEFPLWVWSREQPRRQRLFVRKTMQGLELTDRVAWRHPFPNQQESALESWSELEQRGIKLRPRALVTTLYARLVLCDLFIHGIGGSKYDELTDEIIRRWFGIEPPAYVTATATVQLPLNYPQIGDDDLRIVHQQLRQLRYHAEGMSDDSALVARKQQLLAEVPPCGARAAWHRELTAVNEALHSSCGERSQILQDRAASSMEQYRLSRLLGSREFSFAIFPGAFVRNLLLDLSRVTA